MQTPSLDLVLSVQATVRLTHPLGHCRSGLLPRKSGRKRLNCSTVGLTTPFAGAFIHLFPQTHAAEDEEEEEEEEEEGLRAGLCLWDAAKGHTCCCPVGLRETKM